ncbi:hypothetical protein [Nocardia sp. NPDC059239]|uniref:phage tail fiber protein n=1 Tax=unclassified Nocardia TaxID=2637762 RepID=UPI0036B03371
MSIAIATTRQVLADAYKTLSGASTVWVSLHTSDPTTVGNNEATGGGYVRIQGTWASGTGGALTMAELSFTAPAGTYTHVGLWSASTSGTFYDKCGLSPNITINAAGTIKVTPQFALS